MWETLNSDERASSQKKRRDLRELVAAVWFSDDGNLRGRALRRSGGTKRGCSGGVRDESWTQLGVDLNRSNASLGPETIAVLAHEYRVNA